MKTAGFSMATWHDELDEHCLVGASRGLHRGTSWLAECPWRKLLSLEHRVTGDFWVAGLAHQCAVFYWWTLPFAGQAETKWPDWPRSRQKTQSGCGLARRVESYSTAGRVWNERRVSGGKTCRIGWKMFQHELCWDRTHDNMYVCICMFPLGKWKYVALFVHYNG